MSRGRISSPTSRRAGRGAHFGRSADEVALFPLPAGARGCVRNGEGTSVRPLRKMSVGRGGGRLSSAPTTSSIPSSRRGSDEVRTKSDEVQRSRAQQRAENEFHAFLCACARRCEEQAETGPDAIAPAIAPRAETTLRCLARPAPTRAANHPSLIVNSSCGTRMNASERSPARSAIPSSPPSSLAGARTGGPAP